MDDRYLIVRRPFKADGEDRRHGEVVDTRSWRNTRSLLESGYLKRPSGQQENEKVQEFKDSDESSYKT